MLTLAALEEFSKANEHAIAAIAAVGTVLAAFATFSAVIVSLRLARRNETVRLKAVLGISFTAKPPSRQYVTLRIQNMGLRVGSLPATFFEWTFPFRRRRQPETMANMVNKQFVINPQEEINVGAPMIIPIADIEDFRRFFSRELPFVARKIKRFRTIRFKMIGAMIYTNENRRFRVKFAKAIKYEIRSLVQTYLRKDAHPPQ